MAENLWGKLPASASVQTPHSILLEQAQQLTELTDGKLVGEVKRIQQPSSSRMGSNLYIIAPSLNNYRYGVLGVQHDIAPLYPVTVTSGGLGKSCSDESALKAEIAEVLTSQRIHDVVAGLLAQIDSDAPNE